MPRYLVVLSGGSRGFGRALSLAFARAIEARGDALSLVLLGRDAAGMRETCELARSLCPSARTAAHAVDLSDLESIEPAWRAAARLIVDGSGGGLPDVAVLVNNSGSLGELRSVSDLSALAEVRSNIDLNITGVVWLTSLFLRAVHAGEIVARRPPPAAAAGAPGSAAVAAPPPTPAASAAGVVVNISSLCAVKPFATQALYCLGKAARDMLHAVVAMEEAAAGAAAGTAGSDAAAVVTLNYAPGPLDTDMQRELRESETLERGMHAAFVGMAAAGTLISPNASADKCVALVLSGAYASGAHLDYYDL